MAYGPKQFFRGHYSFLRQQFRADGYRAVVYFLGSSNKYEKAAAKSWIGLRY